MEEHARKFLFADALARHDALAVLQADVTMGAFFCGVFGLALALAIPLLIPLWIPKWQMPLVGAMTFDNTRKWDAFCRERLIYEVRSEKLTPAGGFDMSAFLKRRYHEYLKWFTWPLRVAAICAVFAVLVGSRSYDMLLPQGVEWRDVLTLERRFVSYADVLAVRVRCYTYGDSDEVVRYEMLVSQGKQLDLLIEAPLEPIIEGLIAANDTIVAANVPFVYGRPGLRADDQPKLESDQDCRLAVRRKYTETLVPKVLKLMGVSAN